MARLAYSTVHPEQPSRTSRFLRWMRRKPLTIIALSALILILGVQTAATVKLGNLVVDVSDVNLRLAEVHQSTTRLEADLDATRKEVIKTLAGVLKAIDMRLTFMESDLFRAIEGVHGTAEKIALQVDRLQTEVDEVKHTLEGIKAGVADNESRDVEMALALADIQKRLAVTERYLELARIPKGGFVQPVYVVMHTSVLIRAEGTGEVLDSKEFDEDMCIGTGFFIERGKEKVFVTAGHLFEMESASFNGVYRKIIPPAPPQPDPNNPGKYLPQGQPVVVEVPAVCTQVNIITKQWINWKGEHMSLALGHTSVAPVDIAVGTVTGYDGPTSVLSEVMPETGDPIWVVTNRPSTKVGELSAPGVYVGPKGMAKNDTDAFYTHMGVLPVYYGYSGSPVIWDNKVVGIVVHLYPGNLMGFTSIKEILDILKKTGH